MIERLTFSLAFTGILSPDTNIIYITLDSCCFFFLLCRYILWVKLSLPKRQVDVLTTSASECDFIQ